MKCSANAGDQEIRQQLQLNRAEKVAGVNLYLQTQ